MRVAGCAQVGQGAVGAVTFTSRGRPWSSSVRVSTWSGDGRRRVARSFNNTGSFFPWGRDDAGRQTSSAIIPHGRASRTLAKDQLSWQSPAASFSRQEEGQSSGLKHL